MVSSIKPDKKGGSTGYVDQTFVRSKGSRTVIDIGFEWEIPYIDHEGASIYRFKEDYLVENGYSYHYDSGGLECCSPVFDNLATARSYARDLIDAAKKVESLNPDAEEDKQYGNTGIHVHVGVKGITQFQLKYLLNQINLTTNHSDSADWIWKLSGRKEHKSYCRNAKVHRWDSFGVDKFDHNDSMFRFNSPSGVSTIEFRLWDGRADRLVPALDFAHSMVKFTMRKERTRMKDVKAYCMCNAKDYTPLGEYLEWLQDRKGYKALKEDLNAQSN